MLFTSVSSLNRYQYTIYRFDPKLGFLKPRFRTRELRWVTKRPVMDLYRPEVRPTSPYRVYNLWSLDFKILVVPRYIKECQFISLSNPGLFASRKLLVP